MPAELIDTHCHLHLDPLGPDLDAVMARARQAGVVQCLTIATNVESAKTSVALAARFPGLRVAVGVHPEEAESVTDDALAAIEQLAQDPAVAAIGEIGLDDYWRQDLLDVQARVLRAHVAIATRRNLPMSIHCRGTKSYDRLMSLLREIGGSLAGVIHCASGPPAFIEQALALGLHVSFAGNVTFPKAEALRQLVPLVPDDRLLLETDAPFLAPQPVRGRKNEPAFVAHTAEHVARLRGSTAGALAALTTRNARRLFGFPPL